MRFDVEIQPLRYAAGAVTRHVEVPDAATKDPVTGARLPDEALCDLVFHHGQNDFQPLGCCSVSVGDVIHITLPTSAAYYRYLVKSVGFEKIVRADA